MKIDIGYRKNNRKKKNNFINALIAFYLGVYISTEILNLNAEDDSLPMLLLSIVIFLILNKTEKFLKRKKKHKINKRKIEVNISFKLKEILVVIIPILYFNNRREFGGNFQFDLLIGSLIPIYLIIKFNLIKLLFRKITYKSITMYKIDKMSGEEFEAFLEEMFEKLDYKVFRTQLSGDYGADLVIENGKEKIVVQAKRYSKNVGLSAVQEVVSAKKYYECTKAIVVTNSYYTKPAKDLAKVNRVKLYDRDWIEENIQILKKAS